MEEDGRRAAADTIVPIPLPRSLDTHSLIRTMTALTLTCTYVMWAIVYLAQLHPVIRGYSCLA